MLDLCKNFHKLRFYITPNNSKSEKIYSVSQWFMLNKPILTTTPVFLPARNRVIQQPPITQRVTSLSCGTEVVHFDAMTTTTSSNNLNDNIKCNNINTFFTFLPSIDFTFLQQH